MRERDNNFYMDYEDTGFGIGPIEQNEALANIINPPAPAPSKQAEEKSASDAAIDALKKQILGQGLTEKWSGQGRGSAEANAEDMAKILAGIGITDIKQFGPITREVDAYIGTDDSGNPIYEKQTEKTFGNKETGQAVPLTYSGRQTGNFFGGTYEGKGNTGYGVQFDAQGNPYFYTQGASSNTLSNLMQDMGPVFQIGMAIATGGLSIPQQIAANMAMQVLSGQDMGTAIKNAAVSLAVAQIPGTDFMKEANKYIGTLDLPAGVTNTLNSSFQNAAMSGARALLTGQDVSDAMLKGAAAGGTSGAVNALMREIPDFDKLSKNQQRMATNAVIGVVSGRPLDQIVINAAIAAANAEVAEQKKYAPLSEEDVSYLTDEQRKVYEASGSKGLAEYNRAQKAAVTTPNADVDALQKSGLPVTTPPELTITGNRDYDDFLASIGITNPTKLKDSGLSNKDIEDLIHGRTPVKKDDRVTVTTQREPEPVENPVFQTPVSPTAPNIGSQGNMLITTNRLPQSPELPPPDPVSLITNPIFTTPVSPNAPNIGPQGTMTITTNRLPKEPEPPIDPVSLITDPLTPTKLPPTVVPPTAPPTPAPSRINIDPVKALETFYNPFTPTPRAAPVQSDTGPIQLMTDIFGTNIATTQKAGARGYGFSAGGEIDELLRLLRS